MLKFVWKTCRSAFAPFSQETKENQITGYCIQSLKVATFCPRHIAVSVPFLRLKGKLVVGFLYRSEFHTQLVAMFSCPMNWLLNYYQCLINEDSRPSTVSSWLSILTSKCMTRQDQKSVCIFVLPFTDLANNAKVVLLFCLRKYLTKI